MDENCLTNGYGANHTGLFDTEDPMGRRLDNFKLSIWPQCCGLGATSPARFRRLRRRKVDHIWEFDAIINLLNVVNSRNLFLPNRVSISGNSAHWDRAAPLVAEATRRSPITYSLQGSCSRPSSGAW